MCEFTIRSTRMFFVICGKALIYSLTRPTMVVEKHYGSYGKHKNSCALAERALKAISGRNAWERPKHNRTCIVKIAH